MDMKTIVLNMLPFWILGWTMIYLTYKSDDRDLLKVSPKAVLKWMGYLAILTVYRVVAWKYMSAFMGDKVNVVASIPWQATLSVFWEDAAHTLPVALLGRWMGEGKLAKAAYYAAMALMTVSFGLGHVYQGIPAACMLSMYIPVTINLAKKHGFGTIMIGHVLYDLTTIVTIKHMLGLL